MANKNHYTIRQLIPSTGFLAIWTMPVSVDGQEQPDGQRAECGTGLENGSDIDDVL